MIEYDYVLKIQKKGYENVFSAMFFLVFDDVKISKFLSFTGSSSSSSSLSSSVNRKTVEQGIRRKFKHGE